MFRMKGKKEKERNEETDRERNVGMTKNEFYEAQMFSGKTV
jgi:hypothetical protein